MSKVIQLNRPVKTLASTNEATAQVCDRLGLTLQAQRYRNPNTEMAMAHAKLTPDQYVVWAAFCPRAYEEPELHTYAFDTIPPEVLDLWDTCKREMAFERYEIRTTETVDPILLARFGASVFLLARWGDESPSHLSFDEICKALAARARSQAKIMCKYRALWGGEKYDWEWLKQHAKRFESIGPYNMWAALERLGHPVMKP
jgi:hypothetical protein